jgi:hypothetical protein
MKFGNKVLLSPGSEYGSNATFRNVDKFMFAQPTAGVDTTGRAACHGHNNELSPCVNGWDFLNYLSDCQLIYSYL